MSRKTVEKLVKALRDYAPASGVCRLVPGCRPVLKPATRMRSRAGFDGSPLGLPHQNDNEDEVNHNCVSYPVSPWDTVAYLEPNTSDRPNCSDFHASAGGFDVKD